MNKNIIFKKQAIILIVFLSFLTIVHAQTQFTTVLDLNKPRIIDDLEITLTNIEPLRLEVKKINLSEQNLSYEQTEYLIKINQTQYLFDLFLFLKKRDQQKARELIYNIIKTKNDFVLETSSKILLSNSDLFREYSRIKQQIQEVLKTFNEAQKNKFLSSFSEQWNSSNSQQKNYIANFLRNIELSDNLFNKFSEEYQKLNKKALSGNITGEEGSLYFELSLNPSMIMKGIVDLYPENIEYCKATHGGIEWAEKINENIQFESDECSSASQIKKLFCLKTDITNKYKVDYSFNNCKNNTSCQKRFEEIGCFPTNSVITQCKDNNNNTTFFVDVNGETIKYDYQPKCMNSSSFIGHPCTDNTIREFNTREEAVQSGLKNSNIPITCEFYCAKNKCTEEPVKFTFSADHHYQYDFSFEKINNKEMWSSDNGNVSVEELAGSFEINALMDRVTLFSNLKYDKDYEDKYLFLSENNIDYYPAYDLLNKQVLFKSFSASPEKRTKYYKKLIELSNVSSNNESVLMIKKPELNETSLLTIFYGNDQKLKTTIPKMKILEGQDLIGVSEKHAIRTSKDNGIWTSVFDIGKKILFKDVKINIEMGELNATQVFKKNSFLTAMCEESEGQVNIKLISNYLSNESIISEFKAGNIFCSSLKELNKPVCKMSEKIYEDNEAFLLSEKEEFAVQEKLKEDLLDAETLSCDISCFMTECSNIQPSTTFTWRGSFNGKPAKFRSYEKFKISSEETMNIFESKELNTIVKSQYVDNDLFIELSRLNQSLKNTFVLQNLQIENLTNSLTGNEFIKILKYDKVYFDLEDKKIKINDLTVHSYDEKAVIKISNMFKYKTAEYINSDNHILMLAPENVAFNTEKYNAEKTLHRQQEETVSNKTFFIALKDMSENDKTSIPIKIKTFYEDGTPVNAVKSREEIFKNEKKTFLKKTSEGNFIQTTQLLFKHERTKNIKLQFEYKNKVFKEIILPANTKHNELSISKITSPQLSKVTILGKKIEINNDVIDLGEVFKEEVVDLNLYIDIDDETNYLNRVSNGKIELNVNAKFNNLTQYANTFSFNSVSENSSKKSSSNSWYYLNETSLLHPSAVHHLNFSLSLSAQTGRHEKIINIPALIGENTEDNSLIIKYEVIEKGIINAGFKNIELNDQPTNLIASLNDVSKMTFIVELENTGETSTQKRFKVSVLQGLVESEGNIISDEWKILGETEITEINGLKKISVDVPVDLNKLKKPLDAPYEYSFFIILNEEINITGTTNNRADISNLQIKSPIFKTKSNIISVPKIIFVDEKINDPDQLYVVFFHKNNECISNNCLSSKTTGVIGGPDKANYTVQQSENNYFEGSFDVFFVLESISNEQGKIIKNFNTLENYKYGEGVRNGKITDLYYEFEDLTKPVQGILLSKNGFSTSEHPVKKFSSTIPLTIAGSFENYELFSQFYPIHSPDKKLIYNIKAIICQSCNAEIEESTPVAYLINVPNPLIDKSFNVLIERDYSEGEINFELNKKEEIYENLLEINKGKYINGYNNSILQYIEGFEDYVLVGNDLTTQKITGIKVKLINNGNPVIEKKKLSLYTINEGVLWNDEELIGEIEIEGINKGESEVIIPFNQSKLDLNNKKYYKLEIRLLKNEDALNSMPIKLFFVNKKLEHELTVVSDNYLKDNIFCADENGKPNCLNRVSAYRVTIRNKGLRERTDVRLTAKIMNVKDENNNLLKNYDEGIAVGGYYSDLIEVEEFNNPGGKQIEINLSLNQVLQPKIEEKLIYELKLYNGAEEIGTSVFSIKREIPQNIDVSINNIIIEKPLIDNQNKDINILITFNQVQGLLVNDWLTLPENKLRIKLNNYIEELNIAELEHVTDTTFKIVIKKEKIQPTIETTTHQVKLRKTFKGTNHPEQIITDEYSIKTPVLTIEAELLSDLDINKDNNKLIKTFKYTSMPESSELNEWNLINQSGITGNYLIPELNNLMFENAKLEERTLTLILSADLKITQSNVQDRTREGTYFIPSLSSKGINIPFNEYDTIKIILKTKNEQSNNLITSIKTQNTNNQSAYTIYGPETLIANLQLESTASINLGQEDTTKLEFEFDKHSLDSSKNLNLILLNIKSKENYEKSTPPKILLKKTELLEEAETTTIIPLFNLSINNKLCDLNIISEKDRRSAGGKLVKTMGYTCEILPSTESIKAVINAKNEGGHYSGKIQLKVLNPLNDILPTTYESMLWLSGEEKEFTINIPLTPNDLPELNKTKFLPVRMIITDDLNKKENGEEIFSDVIVFKTLLKNSGVIPKMVLDAVIRGVTFTQDDLTLTTTPNTKTYSTPNNDLVITLTSQPNQVVLDLTTSADGTINNLNLIYNDQEDYIIETPAGLLYDERTNSFVLQDQTLTTGTTTLTAQKIEAVSSPLPNGGVIKVQKNPIMGEPAPLIIHDPDAEGLGSIDVIITTENGDEIVTLNEDNNFPGVFKTYLTFEQASSLVTGGFFWSMTGFFAKLTGFQTLNTISLGTSGTFTITYNGASVSTTVQTPVEEELPSTIPLITNLPPEIISTPLTEAIEGQEYIYQLSSMNEENDTLIYSLVIGPEEMTINPLSGQITWIPSKKDAETQKIIVSVNDGINPSVEQEFILKLTHLTEQQPVIPPVICDNLDVNPALDLNFNNGASIPGIVGGDPQSVENAPLGQAFDFDGKKEFIQLNNNPISSQPDQFTYSFWIYPRNAESSKVNMLIDAYQDHGNTYGYGMSLENGVIVGKTSKPITYVAYPDVNKGMPKLESNKWYHIAYSYDKDSKKTDLFVNGNLVYENTFQNPITQAVNPRIAGQIKSFKQAERYYDGFMDEFEMYNQLIDPEKIKNYYETCRPGTQTPPPENNLPEFTSEPLTNAKENEMYNYIIKATDKDNDVLSFTSEGPAGIIIEELPKMGAESRARMTWSPTSEQLGEQNVKITVSDNKQQVVQEFTILVESNNPPIFTSEPVTVAEVNEVYYYIVNAEDPEGNPIELVLIESPENMRLTENIVEWTPSLNQKGDHSVNLRAFDTLGKSTDQQFTITVSKTQICGDNIKDNNEACDGEDLAEETCISKGYTEGTLSCTNTCEFNTNQCVINHAPVIISTPVLNAIEKTLYEYQLTVVDEDEADDRLIFSLRKGPEGMIINEQTGLVTWTPTQEQVGKQEIEVEVDDQTGTINAFSNQQFTITVLPIEIVCGNNIKEEGELCDGDDLKGETCQSQEFSGGELRCSLSCDSFDTSGCLEELPIPSECPVCTTTSSCLICETPEKPELTCNQKLIMGKPTLHENQGTYKIVQPVINFETEEIEVIIRWNVYDKNNNQLSMFTEFYKLKPKEEKFIQTNDFVTSSVKEQIIETISIDKNGNTVGYRIDEVNVK